MCLTCLEMLLIVICVLVTVDYVLNGGFENFKVGWSTSTQKEFAQDVNVVSAVDRNGLHQQHPIHTIQYLYDDLLRAQASLGQFSTSQSCRCKPLANGFLL